MTLGASNRMTVAEYRKEMDLDPVCQSKPNRASKWGNKPEWYESPMVGIRRYDSKREANRARKLDMMVTSGAVVAWWSQVPVYCGFDNDKGTPIRMIVDFKILWPDGTVDYEDAKGPKPTRDWINKQNAVRDLHGIHVRTV